MNNASHVPPFFDRSSIPAEMSERVDLANQAIANARRWLKEEVAIGDIEDIPMVKSQAEIFFQGQLRRAFSFLEGGKHALNAGHGLLALAAMRCIYETIACIHDFTNRIIALIDAGDITSAVRLAHQRSMATRTEYGETPPETYDFKAVNILTQIDVMKKTIKHARNDYDQLSEFVHPNAMGALFYFIKPDTPENTVQFEVPSNDGIRLMELFIGSAEMFWLINDDMWRFQLAMLSRLEKDLQLKIDDYNERTAR